MRHSKAGLVVVIGACVVLAVMTVFAIELSNTQAKSKNGIEVQVHQRAVLAEALIGSLVQTIQQEVPQDSTTYGAAIVTNQLLDTNAAKSSGYLALLRPDAQCWPGRPDSARKPVRSCPHPVCWACSTPAIPTPSGTTRPTARRE